MVELSLRLELGMHLMRECGLGMMGEAEGAPGGGLLRAFPGHPQDATTHPAPASSTGSENRRALISLILPKPCDKKWLLLLSLF